MNMDLLLFFLKEQKLMEEMNTTQNKFEFKAEMKL